MPDLQGEGGSHPVCLHPCPAVHTLLPPSLALTALNGGELGCEGSSDAGVTQFHNGHMIILQVLQNLADPLLLVSTREKGRDVHVFL